MLLTYDHMSSKISSPARPHAPKVAEDFFKAARDRPLGEDSLVVAEIQWGLLQSGAAIGQVGQVVQVKRTENNIGKLFNIHRHRKLIENKFEIYDNNLNYIKILWQHKENLWTSYEHIGNT